MSSTRIYADLMKLSLAMKSYQELGGDAKGLKKAETILKRYKGEFDAMVDTMIEPLLEEGLAGLSVSSVQTKLTQSRRGTLDADEAIGVASAIQEVMGWFNSRLQKLKEAYPDKRTKNALCAISSACHDDFIDLNALLQVPRASKATTIGKWIAMACEELNQANEVELAIADLQETNILAEEIKSIDVRIRAGNLSEDDRLTHLQDREDKFDLLLDMTRNTANREAALSVASSIINTNTSFQTRTGEKQGLTPEQEEAMMVSGKSIIAAGAGSGKTRVLASKIAYTINELGVSPEQIIATTFSKEAAGELEKRALKYSDGSAKGKYVGSTTHSISYHICNKANVFRGKDLMKDSQADSIIKAAIAQVTLRSTTQVEVVPTPFIDTSKAIQSSPLVQETLSEEDQFQYELKQLLIRTTQVIADKALWGQSKGYGWANKDLRSLGSIITSTSGLNATLVSEDHSAWGNPRFQAMINDIISSNRGSNSLQKAEPFPGFTGRFASQYATREDSEVSFNQWFNLGEDRMDMINKDLNEKDYAKFIGMAKAKLQSPTELWFEASADDKQFVAVYGAYEYLKAKKKMYDFDDMLLNANKVIVENPQVLKRLQSTYKYIFVDEAQDLNKSQHTLFGLIAGHMNPETLEPYGDGRMTADTYCFIGDDKQAIYEFRGADPDEFIGISNTQGGEFKTSILRTNFRSGRNIVQAANKLIAHNSKQIPMTCNPNASKEEGRVSSEGYMESLNPMSPGAEDIAEEMKQLVELEGWDHEGGGQHKFGIGCRTNKELKGYAFELLVQGLPYYSKRDLLDSVTMLAPVDLMSVKSLDPKLRAKALFSGHKRLLFYIDRYFNETVGDKSQDAGMNPLDWFLSGGYAQVYPRTQRKKNANAKAYADALQSIMDFEGNTQELIEFVSYEVRGVDGKNLMERLGRNLSSSELNDLAEETESGDISQDTMEQYADSGSGVVRRVMEDRTLEEGLEFFMSLKEQSKAMQGNQGKKNCVFLGTMHSWKGLECRDMYLPMTNGEFPDKRSPIDSERRLAYVAITRGQDRVKVLYGPGKNPENERTGGPSQFITEACVPSESSLNLRSASLKGATIEGLDFMYAMEQFLSNS
ncbi:MAG: ATP-dependent helicase [Candidatus Peribacter sp.]|jgi:DNA helicase II / ATP-dependent DNA helicase PcrA|nr:ATP-dependent helicase [Candidatus Peribacter sp.]